MKLQTKKKIAGFTLIELLIAMAVTLILLYAAVQVFQNATYSNQIVVQSADMTDNMRAGLNLIQQDLQQAGAGIPVGGIYIPFTANGSGCGTTPTDQSSRVGRHHHLPPVQCHHTRRGAWQFLGARSYRSGCRFRHRFESDPNGITDEITMLYQDNSLKLDNLPVYDAAKCPNGSMSLAGTTLTVKFDPACINLSHRRHHASGRRPHPVRESEWQHPGLRHGCFAGKQYFNLCLRVTPLA